MCSPTLVFTVVATVAQGYMVQQQAKEQAEYQQGVGEYNARVEENKAQQIATKGVQEENIHRRKVAKLAATQKAQFAAAGVDVGSGSALAIQEETVEFGDIDALRIRQSFQEQSASLIEQSELTRGQATAQAGLTRQAGRNVLIGSLLSAGGTATFGKGGIADKWFSPRSAANAAPITTSRGSRPVLSGGGGAPVFASR